MPLRNPKLTLDCKENNSSILTCDNSVAQNSQSNIFKKIMFMIDEQKNLLNDPFFFVKLGNNNSYKLSKYCSNQGCTFLVQVFNIRLFCFKFWFCYFCKFFSLVLSVSSFKGIRWLIPYRETFYTIIESGGSSTVGTYLDTQRGPFNVIRHIFLSLKMPFILFCCTDCNLSLCSNLLILHIGGYICFQEIIIT